MERQFTEETPQGIQDLQTLTYKQYPAGREKGLLVVGGAEKEAERKHTAIGCQRVGRKGRQRWRKKS